MTADQEPRSEQQEHLEPEFDPHSSDAEGRTARPSPPDAVPATQLTRPGGGGPPDEEATEIADDEGLSYPAGPETDAVRIDESEEGSGRVWR